MRIAMCFQSCHRRGGIERVVLETANFLAGRGHDVHLFAHDWDASLLHPAVQCHPVRVLEHAPGLIQMLAYALFSRRTLAAMDPAPDVVGVFGIQCPSGVLWVPSVHGAWLRICRENRSFLGRLKQRCNPFHAVTLALDRFYFQQRRYTKLLALTEDVRADLMSLYKVPKEDIKILPYGYAENEFSIEARKKHRVRVRKELGYADSDRVVIFVANESKRKGFAPLLRAVASLEDTRVHILAVGRLDPAECREEIARLGYTDRVHFTGPSGDVAPLYSAADVFALPTQYEAWGLVIIEAMACGLPVVTSRLAGAAVAVREGETGRLVNNPSDSREIADALRPMLDGKHVTAEEISASVADYKWPSIFDRYEEALAASAKQTVREPVEEPARSPVPIT